LISTCSSWTGSAVTGQQETEHRLRYAQKMEALGDMTAGICHDFNNVIQAICGSLDLLLEQVEDEQLAKLADAALSAAGRSVDLMRKLVSFARSSELQPVEIDMNRHVEGLADVLRSSVGRNIDVQTKLDPTIGTVYLDPSELDAAILNLAVNARDAMPRGGSLRLATYEADAETARGAGLAGGRFVALEVADTGEGIPEAIRDRIFEPYFTTKAEGRGTGLGLAMIYGFVSQSGGQILMHSKEGQGTTFTLLFPRFESR
jgi:signal transduction histidine kinase